MDLDWPAGGIRLALCIFFSKARTLVSRCAPARHMECQMHWQFCLDTEKSRITLCKHLLKERLKGGLKLLGC